jgi:hypothetical protein
MHPSSRDKLEIHAFVLPAYQELLGEQPADYAKISCCTTWESGWQTALHEQRKLQANPADMAC